MTTKKLERELHKIYQEAEVELNKKWNNYMAGADKRIEKKEKQKEKAQKEGNEDEVKRLNKEIIREKKGLTLQNKQYKDMLEETTKQLANINQTALAYTNEQLPMFYKDTYNSELKFEAAELGINYGLVDEATVKRLVTQGDIELPQKKMNIRKDERWNTKYINAQVTQGIIQGESMEEISDRLFPEMMSKTDTSKMTEKEKASVIHRNEVAAIRIARTLVNGAENAGRYDRYQELAKRGVVMKKVWIAVGDSRTRDLHLYLDGQEKDLDEPFVDPDGNDLRYPHDPSAPAETVYNCRCSIRARIFGFRKADGRIVETGVSGESAKHKAEIEQEKERREEEKKEKEKRK